MLFTATPFYSYEKQDRGLPSSVIQEFICDIFGKRYVGTYEEGLVDSIDAIAFRSRVKNCKNIWEAREKVYLQPGQDSFFEYFMRYYAEVISTTMLRGTRISVGLGLPPTIFTTNSSESLNAALKRKVDHKETEWPQFNDAVKQYISGQRDEVLRAISGRGEYKISQEYDSLLVSPQEWTKMTPDQRKCAVKKFDSAKLKHIEVAVSNQWNGQWTGKWNGQWNGQWTGKWNGKMEWNGHRLGFIFLLLAINFSLVCS